MSPLEEEKQDTAVTATRTNKRKGYTPVVLLFLQELPVFVDGRNLVPLWHLHRHAKCPKTVNVCADGKRRWERKAGHRAQKARKIPCTHTNTHTHRHRHRHTQRASLLYHLIEEAVAAPQLHLDGEEGSLNVALCNKLWRLFLGAVLLELEHGCLHALHAVWEVTATQPRNLVLDPLQQVSRLQLKAVFVLFNLYSQTSRRRVSE